MDERARVRANAMSHVLRLEIIAVLLRGPASASELSEEIEVPVEKVRFQIRRLRDQGFIAEAGMRQRRGTVERYYAAFDGEMVLDQEERAELPEHVKRALDASLLKVIFRESLRAFNAGTMSARYDATLAHFPMSVDAQGWDELVALHDETLERLQTVKDKNTKRLAASGEKAIPTSSVAMLFANPSSVES